MRRRRLIAIAGVIVAAAIVAMLCHQRSPDGASSKTVLPEPTSVKNVASARYVGSVGIQNVLPPLANPLSNLLPDFFASPAKKLQRLTALGDPYAAQLQALRSGDPLLVAHALYLTQHCMDMAVLLHGKSAREVLTASSYDAKTGKKKPPDESLIALHEAMRMLGPQRIRPALEDLDEFVKLNEKWLVSDPPDYARDAELAKKMAAPMSPAQRASWAAAVEQSASECRDKMGQTIGPEYRAALDRLVVNGVVSAQLFNPRAGWQSKNLGELTDRDYELVQRAITEWQPDGIARLLVGGPAAVGRLDETGFTAYDFSAAVMLDSSLGPLAACALGVSECGPHSTRFRTLCHMNGGCEQPDMAALLRHVFERDGLDPAIIDREINRVVDAYRRRDLEALGVRRKK